ncbi:MAG: LamG domain-containing protein [Anaerolineales bacterium]
MKVHPYLKNYRWLALGLLMAGAALWPVAGSWAQGASVYLPLIFKGTGSGLALRFYGHGTGDIDRVKIKIDAPAVPADVGSGAFTLEFWMKANAADNNGSAACNTNSGWITGNGILDRDVFGNGDFGDYGVVLSNDRIAFGVSVGGNGTTLCGNTIVANGQWHHIAVTRSGGTLQIYVDGQLDAQLTNGPTGNVSYNDNRSTSYPNSDPFLVIGAEKHDAPPQGAYPSYNGHFDELRISNIRLYTGNFTRPSAPFTTNANTMALYHFDTGPAGACTGTVTDSSGAVGGPSNGVCNYGGSGSAGPVYVNDTPFP